MSGPLSRLPALLLLAVALYYAVWGGEYSAFDLRRLARQQDDEAARLAASRAMVDSLRAVAQRMETDPATIEQIARERFGMIEEGEILYRFVRVAPPAEPQRALAANP